MDSPARISQSLLSRVLPFVAIYLDDLRQSLRHWACLAWVAAGLLLAAAWFAAPGAHADKRNAAVSDPNHAARSGSGNPARSGHPNVARAERSEGREPNAPSGRGFDEATRVEPPNVVRTERSDARDPNGTAWEPVGARAEPNVAGSERQTVARYQPTERRDPTGDPSASTSIGSATPITSGPYESLSALAARLLKLHLLLGATFAIALGASSISGETEIVADAVLCRGVSRWQYYLGKCLARVTITALLFVVLTVLTIGLAMLRLSNDLSLSGLTVALRASAGALGCIAAVAVAGSVWFRGQLAAVAVVWMGVYGVGIIVALLGLPSVSPLLFADGLAPVLRGAGPHLLASSLGVFLAAVAATATVASLGYYSVKDL